MNRLFIRMGLAPQLQVPMAAGVGLLAASIPATILLATAPARAAEEAQAEEVERPLAVAPRLIFMPVAALPEAAEIGTEHEAVPLHLVVETDGTVSEITIAESRGEVLDTAVRQAASRLRFEPGTVEGRPTRMRIAFAFALRTPGEPRADAEPRPSDGTRHAPAAVPRGDPAPEAQPEPELEIVVTGTRVPERADRSVIKTQVLTREDIRLTGATNLAELLEAQPGLQVERSFRGTELWIRGLDPEYTLILIDGVRVVGRVGGAIDLSRLPLESVERVEIVRGSSSALYGSDAIGGVVNILTRGPSRKLEADADARVATRDAVFGQARVAGRPAEWLGVSVHAGRQRTAAFRRDPESIGTTGSERRLSSAGGSLTLGSSRAHTAALSVDYSQLRLDGVDAGAGGAVFDRTQLQEQFLSSLRYTHETRKIHLTSVGQYSQFREQYLNDQRGSRVLDSYEDNREHLGQLTTTVAMRWNDAHRTTAGFEVLAQILDSERLASRGDRRRYSPFLEHRWVVAAKGREIVGIVPGVRADIDSQFGSQISPKLALRWDPRHDLTLRASYGRGFRAPSFQELLLRFENPAVGYVVSGNPDLGAESADSGDVSIEYRPSPAWFFSLAGFYNLLSDMIAVVTLENPDVVGTNFSYDNIESAWTRGLEALGIWSPSELLTLTAGYTLTETRDEERERPLTGRPLHRCLLRVISRLPWGISLSSRATLSLDRSFTETDADGASRSVSTDPLFQLDAQLAKSFGENFELYAGGNNLANAGDEYTVLLPRQLYAGVRGTY